MGNLTVGDLRKLIEGVPDETAVLTARFSHEYSQCWQSGSGYGFALHDKDGDIFSEDIYVPFAFVDDDDYNGQTPDEDGTGEQTDLGVRIRALFVQ